MYAKRHYFPSPLLLILAPPTNIQRRGQTLPNKKYNILYTNIIFVLYKKEYFIGIKSFEIIFNRK